VFVILAVLIRQPGVALALIPLAYWLLARVAGGQHRSLPWAQRMWLLVPFMAIGLLLWWIHAVHGATRVSLEKAQMLRLIFAIDRWVWVYVRELLHALLHLGLVLWPLTWLVFGRLSTRALAGACAAVAVLSGLVLWQEGALPQPLGFNLTWDELGLARDLIAGQIAHHQVPRWVQGMVLGGGPQRRGWVSGRPMGLAPTVAPLHWGPEQSPAPAPVAADYALRSAMALL
jgi:hypothetical protein